MAIESDFPEPPAFLVDLLGGWHLSVDADTDIARPDHGTNNQTFLVAQGDQRFVLRISENLSRAQVYAEQRLLRWLRQANLPFEVPEPVATPDGVTVIETPAGPATLCRWLPGVRPDLGSEPELERFGRAVGMLGKAMQLVPPADAPQDWRGAPLPVPVNGPDGEDLWCELRVAGVSDEQTALLDSAAGRVTKWWAGAVGTLPVQDPALARGLRRGACLACGRPSSRPTPHVLLGTDFAKIIQQVSVKARNISLAHTGSEHDMMDFGADGECAAINFCIE